VHASHDGIILTKEREIQSRPLTNFSKIVFGNLTQSFSDFTTSPGGPSDFASQVVNLTLYLVYIGQFPRVKQSLYMTHNVLTR